MNIIQSTPPYWTHNNGYTSNSHNFSTIAPLTFAFVAFIINIDKIEEYTHQYNSMVNATLWANLLLRPFERTLNHISTNFLSLNLDNHSSDWNETNFIYLIIDPCRCLYPLDQEGTLMLMTLSHLSVEFTLKLISNQIWKWSISINTHKQWNPIIILCFIHSVIDVSWKICWWFSSFIF